LTSVPWAPAQAGAKEAEPTKYSPETRRVVSIGDLHGDYDQAQLILTRLGLMGKEGEWTGGDTILVQTGDVTDRGDASGPIFKTLFRLQDEAPKAGGEVILLIGNHELMMTRGQVQDRFADYLDWCTYVMEEETCEDSYKAQEEQSDLGFTLTPEDELQYKCKDVKKEGQVLIADEPKTCHRRAWRITTAKDSTGEMGSEFRRRVLDGRIKMLHEEPSAGLLFVHGGLTPETLDYMDRNAKDLTDQYSVVEAINRRVQDLFRPDGDLSKSNPLVSEEDPSGPAWTRVADDQQGWAMQWHRRKKAENKANGGNGSKQEEAAPSPKERCESIMQVLARTGATTMVIGHNRQLDGIARTKCGGHVVLTDTTISSGFPQRGNLMALEVTEPHDGNKQEDWVVYPALDQPDRRCVPLSSLVGQEEA